MDHAGQRSEFAPGTGPLQIATTLTFTQGSSTYDYSGSSVGTGKNDITMANGVPSVKLWPTYTFNLPATIAQSTDGIVVAFLAGMYSDGPSAIKAYYVK